MDLKLIRKSWASDYDPTGPIAHRSSILLHRPGASDAPSVAVHLHAQYRAMVVDL
jgi:hypothetical protein